MSNTDFYNPMDAILDMFKNADTFSLTVSRRISEIPEIEKQRLPEQNAQRGKANLKSIYDRKKGEANLPDFETLYNDIFNECVAFQKGVSGKDLIKDFNKSNSPFICDHVGKGTKYSEPRDIVWHFYHNIHFMLMEKEDLQKLPVNNQPIIYELSFPENEELRRNLIKHEFTYNAPYMEGVLQLICFFKLNDETKEWLTQFESDFAITNMGLENLALYENGELKFASCTHEGFNSLD